MAHHPSTPTELFAAALAAEPAAPFLVHYDDAAGGRIELSLTTLNNWVAKTGNLLQDELGVEHGERVALGLPPHWLGAVWMLAAWSTGLVVDLDSLSGADLAVVGPDTLESADARDVVAVGLAPMGGPFGAPLPAGVLDYGAEVLGHGDHFWPYDRPAGPDAALVVGGRTLTGSELVTAAADQADALGLGAHGRLMTSANPAGPDGYLSALLAPLAVQGSVVLVTQPDPARMERRTTEEKVTLSLV